MKRVLRSGSLALTLFVLAPLTARADCLSAYVAPGSTSCVVLNYAANTVSASGSADRVVKWKVFNFINGSGFALLFEDKGTVFAASFDSTTNPTYFPAQFFACAERPSNHLNGANVQMCISAN
jgi:hypothetical protein